MKQRNFRKSNAGFTLVELIVVIAIMAILAGVGTVGYGAYIKSANKKADIVTTKNIIRAIKTAGNSYAYNISGEQVSSSGLQVPVGFIVLSNEKFEVSADGATVTTGVGDNIHLMYPSENTENANLFEDILTNTFGNNYASTLLLKSDTWTETNISSLYAKSEEMYNKIQSTSNLLSNKIVVGAANAILSLKGKPTITPAKNGVTAAVSLAENVTKMSEDKFVENWINANEKKNIDYAFGLESGGMATYTAVRAAYNESVASYIDKQASGLHNTQKYKSMNDLIDSQEQCSVHTKEIRNFAENKVDNLVVSDTIHSGLMIDPNNSNYKGSDPHGYKKREQGILPDNVQFCSTCAKLVASYGSSTTAKEDAHAFYQTMQTLASDNPNIDSAKETGSWDYFNNFVNDFSSLYQNLKVITDKLESCIVITVSYEPETKLLNTDISVPLE